MTNKRIRFDRLQKVADHLKAGKLGHKNFNFNVYNKSFGPDTYDKKGCGTNGCSIGEFPFIFPRSFKFSLIVHNILLIKKSSGNIGPDVRKFLNIDIEMYKHLFIPVRQDTKRFKGKVLWYSATKEEVAKNIELFIKKMKG